MVSGPSEIAAGLWVGIQLMCPPSQAVPRDLGRYLASSSLSLGCPPSTRWQDGTCSLLSLSDTAGMVFSCQLLLVLFLPRFLLESAPPRSWHQPPAHSRCSCLARMAAARCPLGRKERRRVPGEVARTDYSLRGINCQAFFLPPCLVPFLQLIPHFLSKIPRELLVCVFPRHVLICHPLPLAVTAQAFHSHRLCCLLSPEQAGGSGVTIRKGRSHQLHARKRCPHRISPCLSSLHLQLPKTAIFFFTFSPCSGDSGPPRECFWWDCEMR